MMMCDDPLANPAHALNDRAPRRPRLGNPGSATGTWNPGGKGRWDNDADGDSEGEEGAEEVYGDDGAVMKEMAKAFVVFSRI
jgi:hypothetical protein